MACKSMRLCVLLSTFKEPVVPLIQLEFEHYEIEVYWVENSRKEGACYPHGYDPRPLCDTFLVPTLCLSFKQ